ncbi:AlpA family phage regulatory protein [Acinetobacter baumannii]|nr:AlpA family phage regulatory protein [Acinetobacter baumannii]
MDLSENVKYVKDRFFKSESERDSKYAKSATSLNKKDVCTLLGVSRDKLTRMEREDESFPKSMKEGVARQAAVYYDYQEIVEWYENWKTNRQLNRSS